MGRKQSVNSHTPVVSTVLKEMERPMGTERIRTLKFSDMEPLLKFELDNREWFERYVDARESSFYSFEGVAQHVASYLSAYSNGTWHPFVIEDSDGKIVGRANLKDIDLSERRAEVGYRIAESACGQGLATRALGRLIQEAKSRWDLTHLVANVYVGNIGSRKVLERCGFLIERISRRAESQDRYTFVLSIE